MSELAKAILLSLIPAVLISVVTAVTAYLTIRYSRSWEKKSEAYSQILEHLSFLVFSSGKYLERMETHSEMSERFEDRLGEGYLQATESLSKIVTIGTFLISDDTVAALRTFMRYYENACDPNPYEEVKKRNSLAKECIERIKACAETDLKKLKGIKSFLFS